MLTRPRLIAGITALVVAAAATIAVVALPKLTPIDIATRYAACVPAGLDETREVFTEESKRCITDTMTEAVVTGQIDKILPIMQEQMRTLPLGCHRAAHIAGAAAWPSDGRWIDVIDSVSKLECSSGLLHGFIDRVATEDFSIDQWRALTAWCDNQRKPGQPNCGDAIGHVAWQSDKDLAKSAEICGLFVTPTWRSECTEGVVMQQYEPVSEKFQRVPLPDDPTSVCVHIPADDTTFDHLRMGCIRGIGYVAAVSLPPIKTEPTAMSEVDIDIVDRAHSLCLLFETQYQGPCSERFFDIVRFRFPPQHLNAAADLLCPIAGPHETMCRERFAVPR
jgi:hypothetical protein